MKKNILIVVDYQNDFVDPSGSLPIPGAPSIAKNIQKEIDDPKYTDIIYTMDTHTAADYKNSEEAALFPNIHCEFNTSGWDLFRIIPRTGIFSDFNCFSTPTDAYSENEFVFLKNAFSIWEGNPDYANWFKDRYDPADTAITIVGVATNYCVFLNAMGYSDIGFSNVQILEEGTMGISHFPNGSEDPSFESSISEMKAKNIQFISNNKEQSFLNFVEAAGDIMTPSKDQVREAIYRVRGYVRDYVRENKLKSLVIGVSGGLDSAVVAALCQEKHIGVPLIGVSIPLTSSDSHKEMAAWVGSKYCTAFQEIDSWEDKIESFSAHDLVNLAVSQVDQVAEAAGFDPKSFDTDVTQGNIKARLRMITLYDLARKTNGLVLSTDNYSELWTGFFTLHGDHNDLGIIQFVEKYWEERPIAYALDIRSDIIEQAPSDGLNVTDNDTDEAQLGISYKELGPVIFAAEGRLPDNLQEIFEDIKDLPRVDAILKRNKALQFKINWPHFIDRSEFGFSEKL